MTWSILEVFGIRETSDDEDEKKPERGETADQKRRRDLDAARSAGNPLATPSKASSGGGQNRPSSISTMRAKSPLPIPSNAAQRVGAGASTLRKKGVSPVSLDKDAPDDAQPRKPGARAPLLKPTYKGSFVGQVWQPRGETEKWTSRYFNVGSGTDSRTSGEREAKREPLYWDGADWVTRANFVMSRRGEMSPTQTAKPSTGQSMTPLPPSRDEYEQRAKREIQRVMSKGSRDREEARRAAQDVYDEYDRKHAEYAKVTGKPVQRIERLPWVSGEKPSGGGAWSDVSKKLGGSGKPTEYRSWADVPDAQRKEIERYLASQEPGKPSSSAASRPSPSAHPEEVPPAPRERGEAPSGAPWRALQKMAAGQSDDEVLARMRARHGMPPKK